MNDSGATSPDPLSTVSRDIADVPSVEIISTAALHLMSAAAVNLGLAEDLPDHKDLDEARSLIDALAGLLDAAEAIPGFDRPVLLVWGDSCEFFPVADAERLASDFPHATLRVVPGAKTWIPVDDPAALSDAIAAFVPGSIPAARRA